MPLTIVRKALSGFAVGAAIAITLSACSPSDGAENKSPSGTTPSSSSASPSPAGSAAASPTTKSASPTPVAASSDGPAKNWPVPKMPAAAKKHDLEGAAAFSKYYFELIEYTSITTKTSPISRVSLSTCTACQENLIVPSDLNRKNKTWNSGGAYSPTITAAQNSKAGHTTVAFKYEQDKRVVYDSKGKINAVYDPTVEPVYGTFRLVWKAGWKMQSIDIIES